MEKALTLEQYMTICIKKSEREYPEYLKRHEQQYSEWLSKQQQEDPPKQLKTRELLDGWDFRKRISDKYEHHGYSISLYKRATYISKKGKTKKTRYTNYMDLSEYIIDDFQEDRKYDVQAILKKAESFDWGEPLRKDGDR